MVSLAFIAGGCQQGKEGLLTKYFALIKFTDTRGVIEFIHGPTALVNIEWLFKHSFLLLQDQY